MTITYERIFVMNALSTLSNFFPLSFGATDVKSLIIKIAIYLIAGAVIGIVLGILGKIPLVKIVTGIVGGLIELYIFAGIVIAILDYCKILK